LLATLWLQLLLYGFEKGLKYGTMAADDGWGGGLMAVWQAELSTGQLSKGQ
jgi:hypothetical protein